MALQTVPEGWQPSQLAALNDLAELAAAYELTYTVAADLNDDTDAAYAVIDGMKSLLQAAWDRVKDFPVTG